MRWASLALVAWSCIACGRLGFATAGDARPPADSSTDTSPSADTSPPADASPDDTGAPPMPRALCFAPGVALPPCDTSGPRCEFPRPVAVGLGKLDGDGNLDLVMGDDQDGVIAVRLGVGDGSFGAPVEYPINWDTQELRIVDVDRDGNRDVVAVSWNSLGVKLFRGAGDGTLAAYENIDGPSTPVSFDLADLDGDGDLDLVTGGEDNQVRVLSGNGDGTFGAPTTLISATNYYAVRVADLNADGLPDILATDMDATLNVLLQDPGGGTWTNFEVDVLAGPVGIVTGDYDRDGKMDVAIAARDAGAVQLLSGDGSGSAFTSMSFSVPPAPVWITQGDLDSDGEIDFVVSHENGGQISILRASTDPLFEPPIHFAMDASLGGGSIHGLAKAALGDVDGDGGLDIVAANPAGRDLTLFRSAPAASCEP